MVHVDDIFAVGRKERCYRLCEDLGKLVPLNHLGELRWYARCQYCLRQGRGFIDDLTVSLLRRRYSKQFGVTAGRNTPLPTDVFVEEFDEDEPDRGWQFRQLVGGSMRLASQTRPDILNAVRASRMP